MKNLFIPFTEMTDLTALKRKIRFFEGTARVRLLQESDAILEEFMMAAGRALWICNQAFNLGVNTAYTRIFFNGRLTSGGGGIGVGHAVRTSLELFTDGCRLTREAGRIAPAVSGYVCFNFHSAHKQPLQHLNETLGTQFTMGSTVIWRRV